MSESSRRAFLGQFGAATAALPVVHFGFGSIAAPVAAAPPGAGQGEVAASAIYDLVIAGGHVVDPAQKLSAVSDVAINAGRIARIATRIPPSQARQVYNATGKIVTPGLFDFHAHVYKYGITTSNDADVVGFGSSVTTLVDCGSAGAGTFMGFRKYVMEPSPNRIYALLNISTIGLVVLNEIYLDPRMIDARAAITTIQAHRDRILGVKVRVNGKKNELTHDLGVMKIARQVADATDLPIMLHWTVEPELLAMLKRGDILSHPFNPPGPNSSNMFGNDVDPQSDTVLPQVLALKDRGIWTDGQAATSHHAWAVSERAFAQGWRPDVITTDYARAPDGSRGNVLLPMSEYLHMGLTLDEVIAGVTTIPAKVLNYPEKLGTLEPGITADVSVLELEQGNFVHPDGRQQSRTLKQRFVSVATVQGGVFLKGAPVQPAVAAPPAASPTSTRPQ